MPLRLSDAGHKFPGALREPKGLTRLKSAAEWGLGVAVQVGVGIATDYVKSQIGLSGT